MRATTKVLAVDDNPVNLEVLHETLGDEYRVRFAHNGQEALRLAMKYKPGIILLDVMMPGMDGLDVCRELRKIQGMEHCAIIMVSAKAMPSEQAAGLEAGADDYITKPFDEVELLQKLRALHDPEAKFANGTLAMDQGGGEIVTVF